jgi:hypothetical protein
MISPAGSTVSFRRRQSHTRPKSWLVRFHEEQTVPEEVEVEVVENGWKAATSLRSGYSLLRLLRRRPNV